MITFYNKKVYKDMKIIKNFLGDLFEGAYELYIVNMLSKSPWYALILFTILKSTFRIIKGKIDIWLEKKFVKEFLSVLCIGIFLSLFRRWLPEKVITGLTILSLSIIIVPSLTQYIRKMQTKESPF